ncbi:type II secretion system protein [Desulfonatronovibrio hydrogenovorans]|uniref:type II secretion system protein n=1 Tax=Desulfonatronovibrio hydrogenovorans TaxID=53245 RepID=UPI00048F26EC|nr:type II secretion system protein [Desulfonatronovibrio hydrogenovorans]
MAMEMRQKPKQQQGFTLLEILVVVAIMGFLVAMVAPRFAGVVSGTIQVVGDTSKNRGEQMIATFFEQNNRYPSGLVNLVMTDGADLATARYQIPYADNEDPDDGAEVIRFNHNNNHKFVIHHLNESEARELRRLGINRMYNLNHYGEVLKDPAVSAGQTVGRRDDADHIDRTSNWANVTVVAEGDKRPMMEAVVPAEGVGVAMAVVGAAAHDATEFFYVGAVRPPSAPRADSFGRIVFGLGPETELVTTGMASNAGRTPVATTTENYTWDGYYMLMPRLEATSERLMAATAFNNIATGGSARDLPANFNAEANPNRGQIVAVGYPAGTQLQPGQIVNGAGELQDGVAQYTKRVVNLLEPHATWDFVSMPTEQDQRWSLVFNVSELP